MIDPKTVANLADKLESVLTEIGDEIDGLKEDLGYDSNEPGEGPLSEAFSIVRQLVQLAQGSGQITKID